jgi:hypothetical protein
VAALPQPPQELIDLPPDKVLALESVAGEGQGARLATLQHFSSHEEPLREVGLAPADPGV